ncbi:MAG: IPT/TIG domain-containing protein [Dehalococcoidia bacterium]
MRPSRNAKVDRVSVRLLGACAVVLMVLLAPSAGSSRVLAAPGDGTGVFNLDGDEYFVFEGETLEVTVLREGGSTLQQDVAVTLELQGGVVDVDYPATTVTQQIIFPAGTNTSSMVARFTTFNRSRIYNTFCGDDEAEGVPNLVDDCLNTTNVVIKSVAYGTIGTHDLAPINIRGRGAPIVENIFPHSGTSTQTIRITGKNFQGVVFNGSEVLIAAVEFNPDVGPTISEVATLAIIDATHLDVNPPATLTNGTEYNVVVVATHLAAVGRSVIVPLGRFTYTAPGRPTVTYLDQRSGPTTGGTQFYITGTNFGVPGGINPPCSAAGIGVTVAGVPVSACIHNSNTRLTITTPPAPAPFTGVTNVIVTNGGGSSPPTVDNEFIYAGAPKITSISPSFGTASGGTSVTILGTGFLSPLSQVDTVRFGGTDALSFQVLSDTRIVAVSPPLNVTVDTAVQIQVIHPLTGASPNTSAATFTYTTGPVVLSLDPKSGPPQGGTTVIITGTGFALGATVSFGSTPSSFVTFESSTRLRVVSPPGSGTVPVLVSVNGRQSAATPESQFQYALPEITSITPNAGPTAGGTPVVIDGKNFTEGVLVRFGTITVASIFVSTEQIRATSPNLGIPLTVDVVVLSPGGESLKHPKAVFTYTDGPVISGLNPNFGPITGGTVVVITGSKFIAPVKVYFGDVLAPAANIDSETQITALSPANGSAGLTPIKVESAAATSPPNDFARFDYRLVLPEVVSVAPATGVSGGGEKITIMGKGFLSAACPGAVIFGTVPAPSCTVIDDTKIEAVTPVHPTGPTYVVVRTPGGESAIVENFEFVSPGGGSGGGGGGSGGGTGGGGSGGMAIPPTGSTITYALPPGWTVIVWSGPESAPLSAVLLNTGGTSLVDVVDAVFLLQADGTVVKLDPALSSLLRGRLYWFHVRGTAAAQLVVVDQ